MKNNLRQYNINECVSFKKTNEVFGGLSNMAGGYPIVVNNIYIRTSEALYQAMRFPDYPAIQAKIISQKSPMAAKIISKKYSITKTRKDWNYKRIAIMKWCLRVKLIQNLETFGSLLDSTDNMNIVELSKNDNFWGAIKINDEIVEGTNAMGRLLMELREIHLNSNMRSLNPLNIDKFLLNNQTIGLIKPLLNKDDFIVKDSTSLF